MLDESISENSNLNGFASLFLLVEGEDSREERSVNLGEM